MKAPPHTHSVIYAVLLSYFKISISKNKIKSQFQYPQIFHSVQFSRSVMSNSLRPHGLQHARPPCSSPTPGVYPLSQWCHPTISSSVVPFSSCHKSFPASEAFQMSQLFKSGGQSIEVSASTSVLPVNTQDWSEVRNQLSEGNFTIGIITGDSVTVRFYFILF